MAWEGGTFFWSPCKIVLIKRKECNWKCSYTSDTKQKQTQQQHNIHILTCSYIHSSLVVSWRILRIYFNRFSCIWWSTFTKWLSIWMVWNIRFTRHSISRGISGVDEDLFVGTWTFDLPGNILEVFFIWITGYILCYILYCIVLCW